MRSELERIMDLQPDWSPDMTGPMVERGQLIRRAGRAWLGTFEADLASALGISGDDFLTSASDGMTKKTEVPWFRFKGQVTSAIRQYHYNQGHCSDGSISC